MPQIEINNLSFAYANGPTILRIERIEIEPSLMYLVSGPSGSGKTTFLKLASGLLKPSNGSVNLLGANTLLGKLVEIEVAQSNVGFIHQSSKLMDNMTISENIMIRYLLGISENIKDIHKARREADNLASICEVSDFMNRYPHEISEGERQRVALAQALFHDPKIVIADEPTANLDYVHREKIIKILVEVVKQGVTVLIASHNPIIFGQIFNRYINIEGGKVAEAKAPYIFR
jgi:cell division transport system ATP-binding protein